MLDDLSPAVERALDAARRRATDGPLNAVHVFLALIEDDESRAAQVLMEAGGDLASVRRSLETHAPLPFDLPAILTGAREVAGERAESTLTGEFLLLGLVRSIEPLLAPLRLGGVRVEQLIRPAEIAPLPFTEPLDLSDAPDHVSAARAVDANANRARESLRVIDDYCRFILDDAVLTQEVKNLRHDLVELLSRIPPQTLHESRETLTDVGTGITAGGEMLRGSPLQVAQVNLKRLQEALRSLEEYGKLLTRDLSAGLEALRYRSYTVEKAINTGADSRTRLENARLYVLLTGATCSAALDWTIREAADGGVDAFQLREKSLTDRELLERARNVRRWTRQTGTLFILNDRPDIARLVEADGVHLGQENMSVREARRIVGTGLLIGVSTHNPDQVRQAILEGANYIGVGPTFASPTKEFGELAGLEFVRQATAMTTLPAFVIGGVNAENISQAVVAGARRIAVSAAICTADDPRSVAVRLRSAVS